jgi:hypothetical protein
MAREGERRGSYASGTGGRGERRPAPPGGTAARKDPTWQTRENRITKDFFPPPPSTHLRGAVSGAADWRRRRYFRGVGQWQRSRPNQYLCGETPGGPQMRNTSADLGPGSHATISFTRYCMARFAAFDLFSPTPLALLRPSVRPSVRSFHATRFTCLLACLPDCLNYFSLS